MDNPDSQHCWRCDTAGPRPAPASAHPYPLSRDNRASRARNLGAVLSLTGVIVMCMARKYYDLLAEAEADVGRARRGGDIEGYDRGRHDILHVQAHETGG